MKQAWHGMTRDQELYVEEGGEEGCGLVLQLLKYMVKLNINHHLSKQIDFEHGVECMYVCRNLFPVF